MEYSKSKWKWEYERQGKLQQPTVRTREGADLIAIVYPKTKPYITAPTIKAAANACLIAAAPEMYEALKGMVVVCDINEATIEINQYPSYWRLALAAIAKAEGKP